MVYSFCGWKGYINAVSFNKTRPKIWLKLSFTFRINRQKINNLENIKFAERRNKSKYINNKFGRKNPWYAADLNVVSKVVDQKGT